MFPINRFWQTLRQTLVMLLLTGLISLISLPAQAVQAFPFPGANQADAGYNNKSLPENINRKAHETDSIRPKTTREWYQEGRETNDKPGERLKRIGEESGQAFKEFGSGYVEGAKQTARQVREGAAKAGEDLSNQVRR